MMRNRQSPYSTYEGLLKPIGTEDIFEQSEAQQHNTTQHTTRQQQCGPHPLEQEEVLMQQR